MPHTSFWKDPDNWTPTDDPDFSSKFKSYSERPDFLGLILTQEIRSLLVALDETHPVRVQMDIGGLYKDGRSDLTNRVPYITVAAYPNSPDFALAEELLKLCMTFRSRVLDLSTRIHTTPSGTPSAVPVAQLFK
jgi:hypothetical protein